MLTPQYLLPPPEPFDYCYEWETGYGIVRKFSATPHHGMPPTRAVALYTADQMRAALSAVPAQPVAWMDDFGNVFPLAANKGAGSWMDDHKRNWKPLYAAPQAVPVPARFTQAQMRRLYDNSPEFHCDVTSRYGFYRIVALTERAHNIAEAAAAPKEQP